MISKNTREIVPFQYVWYEPGIDLVLFTLSCFYNISAFFPFLVVITLSFQRAVTKILEGKRY